MNKSEQIIIKAIQFINSKCECEKITESDCRDCLAYQTIRILQGKPPYFCKGCGEPIREESSFCKECQIIGLHKNEKNITF